MESWKLLTGAQRILARVALDVEKDSPELAAAVRKAIAVELAGDAAPPDGTWSKDLGIESLSERRRLELAGLAQHELDEATLAVLHPARIVALGYRAGVSDRRDLAAELRKNPDFANQRTTP
jgi:hypothetical protein